MSDHEALAFDAWPEADRTAWMTALQPANFLEESGRGAKWRPASRFSARGAYARWLGWLLTTGVVLDAEAPAARINPERMRAYVAFLANARATVTRASYFGVLCMAVRAMFPNDDWQWLQAVQRGLRRLSSPSRGKERRIVPAGQLRRLGLDLIERAGEVLDWPPDATTDRDRTAAARDYRDGLIIALLASRPLRVRNLLGVEIGRHLRQSNSGITLHFPADETKNGRAIHATWPEFLERPLARYLSKVRPLLIAPRAPGKAPVSPSTCGNVLWVGQRGTMLTAGGLQVIFERHARRRFGHVVNPHLVRDCVATTIADLDPDHIRFAAQLLGHRALRVTERSYIAANIQRAVDRHHDLISAIRFEGRKSRRRCRKHGG
jgi:integrase/recombinase XerD